MATFASNRALQRAVLVALLVAAILVGVNQVQQMTARRGQVEVVQEYQASATTSAQGYSTAVAGWNATADANRARLVAENATQAAERATAVAGCPPSPMPVPCR